MRVEFVGLTVVGSWCHAGRNYAGGASFKCLSIGDFLLFRYTETPLEVRCSVCICNIRLPFLSFSDCKHCHLYYHSFFFLKFHGYNFMHQWVWILEDLKILLVELPLYLVVLFAGDGKIMIPLFWEYVFRGEFYFESLYWCLGFLILLMKWTLETNKNRDKRYGIRLVIVLF